MIYVTSFWNKVWIPLRSKIQQNIAFVDVITKTYLVHLVFIPIIGCPSNYYSPLWKKKKTPPLDFFLHKNHQISASHFYFCLLQTFQSNKTLQNLINIALQFSASNFAQNYATKSQQQQITKSGFLQKSNNKRICKKFFPIKLCNERDQ